eukprot:TRINITY_DN11174_c0_g1_i1.p1 TRINITY_DN11174_c0_g1~~TRINITY_DN11174_c0_g1_i1.p1  ORF type:complete len:871 (+),score=176.38 TRINITY_DN11174_c0_g1_i1:64-2676(+)
MLPSIHSSVAAVLPQESSESPIDMQATDMSNSVRKKGSIRFSVEESQATTSNIEKSLVQLGRDEYSSPTRDRLPLRKLPPSMLDVYLPRTTGIMYKATENRGRSPIPSISGRSRSITPIQGYESSSGSPGLSRTKVSGAHNQEASQGYAADAEFSRQKSKSEPLLSHDRASNTSGARYSSDQIQFQVRVAELVNHITKQPSNSPPNLTMLQSCLDLLAEHFRNAGPLEGLLNSLQNYVVGCIFSKYRCASRCCTDSTAPFFEHVRHMENEKDYVRDEYSDVDLKLVKKNDQMKALQEKIDELKALCDEKDHEMQLQRKIFDMEQEKDVTRTMNLYADIEAAESECEAYRLRVVELLDIITQVSKKVKTIELERSLKDKKWEESRLDFSEDWQRIAEIQAKILDSVPKTVLKEAQTELHQKKEALSVLKSKYFALHTANKKLKTLYNEALDRIQEMERSNRVLKESMTPRPILRPFEDLLGDLEEERPTSETLAVIYDRVTGLKSKLEERENSVSPTQKGAKQVDQDASGTVSRRPPMIDGFSSHQLSVAGQALRKYFASLGDSPRVPVFLRNSFTAVRPEHKVIGKHALDVIIKEIFSKRLEELRTLYGNFRSMNREDKYAAGSKLLKSRTLFQDFLLNFLQSRYQSAAIEWAYNIIHAADTNRSDPLCLIFAKIATGLICEDSYFEMQNLIFFLKESLAKMERSKSKKGIQVNMLTADDILFVVHETFPSKADDDMQAVRQLLMTHYNGGHVSSDNLLGEVMGKQSYFLEVLQDQYILDMEEYLYHIEQSLEAGASEFGISPSQAVAVIRTLDPDAPLDVVKNVVAVGFQITVLEMDTLPTSPVDVRVFMKRVKQIMVRRYTKFDRHRR